MYLRKKRTTSLMMMALFSSSLLHANITYKANAAVVQQQAVCKGTVVDSNGEPVVGASVFAVSNGHKKGSVTDLDGNFEIDGIASGSSLTISYVGYKTQQVTWSGKDLKVTLQESSEMLDNVVVVGYGTQKKVNLTGAVSVVSSKTLDSRPVTSVAQALQGEVPGLNFSVGNAGGSLKSRMGLNIRGIGTIGEGSNAAPEEVYHIIHQDVRSEKVAWKDIKLRTFITEGNSRNDLASHVYDVTYECIKPYQDSLVIIDDSIVRGTTLKESILRILDRLHPKKIVVVSSAPQIRFPDYYGIDMPHPEEFCVFRAVVELIRESGQESLLREVYENCKKELAKPKGEPIFNAVRAVYKPFTVDEINKKIVEMLRPEGMTTPVELVFQSVEGLHKAIPNHPGDWYFTGNYPTPGGMRLVNAAFVNYYEREHLNAGKA